ncbi:hypothetical protein A7U60_g7373 [Sanghuangporus baumii]|uniref:Uncharacterized protein n=1 Tax=Sanghuangporus baumii TaxID=108892 RepID=A0A9Q5HTI7_SANBA|nr:hypothetical protein A7U60_g7373 [Sanghuangporus baumii]
MPPFYTHPHGRDDTTSDSSSTGPGQRISVDGGMESKRGIIAMILAIILFIVVLVIYQHLTTEMALREEERSTGTNRHRRGKSSPVDGRFIIQKISMLFRKCASLLRHLLSLLYRPSPPSPTSSHTSMEALLRVRPRRAPVRRPFLNLLCLQRRKESKSKKATRRVPRPLLLNTDIGCATYMPRSHIDEKTQEILRSPDAFAEFSDPVRNMNFVRQRDEFQRRRERDEIWYEEPSDSPDRPVVACVAPLAFRRKTREGSLLREVDDTNGDWAPPSPERVIYPSRQTRAPLTSARPSSLSSASSRESWDDSSTSYVPYSPHSPRCLTTIDEDMEPPTPRSFFEIDEDEKDELRKRRRTFSLKFPFSRSLSKRIEPPKDPDVFSIGSYSSSEE